MTLDEIKQLIEFVKGQELTEFELEQDGFKVRIKSGQTVAIGGLIKEDIVHTTTSVPLLGDIPLVQNLFRHTDRSVKKTDLLFFMTVTVLKEQVPTSHKL